jgi:plastocyanin
MRAWFVIGSLLLATGFERVSAATKLVRVLNYYFVPTNVIVNVGDTVMWRNDSSLFHDATHNAATPLWQKFMASGESAEFTFTEAGSYSYLCVTTLSQLRNRRAWSRSFGPPASRSQRQQTTAPSPHRPS